MVCRQLNLMDSCFSLFGFEITTSTLMAKNLFTVPGPPTKRDASWLLECLWHTSLLSQIMAMHLNLPAKDPQAGSNCLPWKLQLDTNEASLKLTDLLWQCPLSAREAFLVSVWLSVSATWLCYTCFDGPLDAVVLLPSLIGDDHNLATWTKHSPALVLS